VSNEGAPQPVLDLIERNIESVEQLEVLLFLFQWEQGWTASEIFSKIQSSQSSIELRLSQLESAGFILKDSEGRYRFNRTDEKLTRVVSDLADCYRTMRVRIIEAIYARKTDAVQTFADAFKFRRKE
jgi:predicted transcriptional regulator